jgi:hypothetical protein
VVFAAFGGTCVNSAPLAQHLVFYMQPTKEKEKFKVHQSTSILPLTPVSFSHNHCAKKSM